MSVDTRRIGLVESERLIQLAAGGEPIVSDHDLKSGAYRAGDMIGGKYRLVRLIGRGGMGVVWEAHSDALDIRVAIKLIHQYSTSNDEQNRLLLEAKAAARLVDPAVVRIFDCGETLNGEPYVVMELLEGHDLATRLDERGRLQPINAIRTLLPIVRALSAAHNAAIVHRDVKPENVYLAKSMTGEEQPKLLDFGIAKMDLPRDKRLTHAGSTLGSPNYMSPEQARGEEVDGRSDIWGFCVVLYEAITGELPFDGANYNAVMHAILGAKVQTFVELGINEPALWTIVSRGLVRDKALRWQTAGDLGDALRGWLIERGVMHDVTGVSLHATQSNHRSSYVRTLDSVRPPVPDADLSDPARAAVAQTASRLSTSRLRFWRQRPSWFLPVLAGLGLLAVGLLGWRHGRATPRDMAASVTPTTVQVASVQKPVPVGSGANLLDTPPVPSLTATPLAGSQVQTPRAVAKGSSKKPTTAVSSGKRPAASKAEAFKSPFD